MMTLINLTVYPLQNEEGKAEKRYHCKNQVLVYYKTNDINTIFRLYYRVIVKQWYFYKKATSTKIDFGGTTGKIDFAHILLIDSP